MTPSQLNYRVETFGCKVNTYDSSLIQKRLGTEGFVSSMAKDEPQVFILNTCAVTGEATKEALRRIRRLKAENPLSLIVVTGCAAQVDTDQFTNFPGADLVVANSHKGQLSEIIQSYYKGTLRERVFKSNIFKKDDLEAGGDLEQGHSRMFLKIQDGCNSFCTYCVIPFARGKSRSLPISELVRRVQEFEARGVGEVVLTGVHIGDYQDESGGRLEDLIAAVLKQTKMPRIRLTSLEPVEISERLLELFSDERLCPHFHMSIQSAQSKVLKAMKRQYTHQEVEWSLQTIAHRLPQAFVGMDVIVGFPGETVDEYLETEKRLQSLPWTRIHVFPYSSRPGTYAARLTEQVPLAQIQNRAQRLRAVSSERYAEKALEQIGQVKRILGLQKSKGPFQGLSRDYWSIQLEGAAFQGEKAIEITGFDHSTASRMDGLLIGRPIDAQQN